ncbi:MAG: hypothetical protein RR409_05360 [Clostridium sp.]
MEILNFQHFSPYNTFTTDSEDYRNKALKNKIDVQVVVDMWRVRKDILGLSMKVLHFIWQSLILVWEID